MSNRGANRFGSSHRPLSALPDRNNNRQYNHEQRRNLQPAAGSNKAKLSWISLS